jgi:hypothetical protein
MSAIHSKFENANKRPYDLDKSRLPSGVKGVVGSHVGMIACNHELDQAVSY